MSFEFDPIYLVYIFVAASAGLFVEGVYLLCFSVASFRKNVNRGLKLLKDEPNREKILVLLQRERGLTSGGSYSIGVESFNRLLLQSGLTIGMTKLIVFVVVFAVIAFVLGLVFRKSVIDALLICLVCGTLVPYLFLRILRSRRQK